MDPKRTEKEKQKKKKIVGAPYNMWLVIMDYFWRSEKRRSDVFNYFRMSVNSFQNFIDKWALLQKKERQE